LTALIINMRQLRKFFTNTVLFLLLLALIAINGIMYFGKGGFNELFEISGKLIPDLKLIHSNESLMEYFDAWGAQGRLFYIRYQYRDFIYPIIYSVFMSAILIRLIRPRYFNVWVAVPMLAMVFDFVENYYLRVLVYDYPNLISQNITMASVFSSLKWLTILISILLIFIALVRRRKAYSKKMSSKGSQA